MLLCATLDQDVCSNSLCPLSASEQILGRAKGVEAAVHAEFGGVTPAYKSKIRSLFVNLKDKSNPGLRESVVTGDLPVQRFCKMTSQVCRFVVAMRSLFPYRTIMTLSQEMASEERKAADNQIKEENLFNSLGAGEVQAETDAFQCGRCKQVRIQFISSPSSPANISVAEEMSLPSSTDAQC